DGRLVVVDVPPIDLQVVGEVMIDADQFLVEVSWRRGNRPERSRAIGRVGQRHEVLNDLDRVLVHLVLGDRVVGEWLPCCRILDRGWEYAVSHSLGRELPGVDLERACAAPFLREKEERLFPVFVVELWNPYRAAQVPSEVVVTQRRLEDGVAWPAESSQRRCNKRIS